MYQQSPKNLPPKTFGDCWRCVLQSTCCFWCWTNSAEPWTQHTEQRSYTHTLTHAHSFLSISNWYTIMADTVQCKFVFFSVVSSHRLLSECREMASCIRLDTSSAPHTYHFKSHHTHLLKPLPNICQNLHNLAKFLFEVTNMIHGFHMHNIKLCYRPAQTCVWPVILAHKVKGQRSPLSFDM